MPDARSSPHVTKTCSRCGIEKPIDNFYARRTHVEGVCRQCSTARARGHRVKKPSTEASRAANRERMRLHRLADPRNNKDISLRHHFNIDADCFDSMLRAQGGGCAICGTTEPGGKGDFHVDHDHSCCPGKRSCGICVRGLLCVRCNAGIAMFSDNPLLLERATAYVS